MKTIVITGIGDTRNNGCWAMAASAITSIKEASPVPVKFIILNRKNAVDTRRLAFPDVEFVPRPWSLVTTPRVRLLWILFCAGFLSLQALFFPLIKHKFVFPRFWRTVREADLVIDLSGDSISSDYNWIANLTVILPLLLARMIGKPYYLCAQSIGPFGKSRIDRLTISTLKAAALITAREERTVQMLSGYGISDNVHRTQDLAFLLSPVSTTETKPLLTSEDINLSVTWVGMSVSSLISSYAFRQLPAAEREGAYLAAMADFCDSIVETYNLNVLFVPHVVIPGGSDDRRVTTLVRDRMRNKKQSRIIHGDYTGAQLKSLIGICKLFVGSRMHATIAALSQGIPTLTLVYNHKTLGINGDLLGQHDYLIDLREIHQSDFLPSLQRTFQKLVDCSESVREQLNKNLPSIREGARVNACMAVDYLECAGPLLKMSDSQFCTGCGTCVGACPQGCLVMRETLQGTLRPGLRRNCCNCRLCDKVCPALGFDLDQAISEKFVTQPRETVLAYTGHAVDRDIRYNGASGGMVTAVASALLQRGEVDAVLVVRADPENPFQQQSFWATNPADLQRTQGSRYLPAAVNDGFASLPASAQRLAVVGLPCHLWGIHLLEKNGLLAELQIVWRLGLFCGRTPSLHAADALLSGIDATRRDVLRLDFRGDGWPGIGRIHTSQKELRIPLSEMWGHIGTPFFTPLHCFVCPDFFAELSDLSFGDAWLPECRNDNQGTSLVIARNARADALLASLLNDRLISINAVSMESVQTAFAGNIRRKAGSTKKREIIGCMPPVIRHDSNKPPTSTSQRFERLLTRSAQSRSLRRTFYAFPPGRTMRLLKKIASRLNSLK